MFYFTKDSSSDISRKWILPNMIRVVPLPANIINSFSWNKTWRNYMFSWKSWYIVLLWVDTCSCWNVQFNECIKMHVHIHNLWFISDKTNLCIQGTHWVSWYHDSWLSTRRHPTMMLRLKTWLHSLSIGTLWCTISGVARVVEVGGQAGGKGLRQGSKRIREPEEPTLYRQEVSGLLKAPSSWDISDSLIGGFW